MLRNPEFRRNLWLEMTPYRLVGMPLVLAPLFYLVGKINDFDAKSLVGTAVSLYFILAILWGTRLASEAVLSEIRDQTWDSQRLSAISPWQMTWGKLFGATVYPWYGAFLALLVYLAASIDPLVDRLLMVLVLMVTALLAQAIALLVSLHAIRKDRSYSRSQAAAFFVIGLILAISILQLVLDEKGGITWYGINYLRIDFALASVAGFLLLSIIGCHRLIRREFQLKNGPLFWLLAISFLMAWPAGFHNEATEGVLGVLGAERLLIAFIIALAITYGMLLSERKDRVAFERLFVRFKRGSWRQLYQELPGWLVTLLPLSGIALFLVIHPVNIWIAPLVLALVAFLLRDMGLILFLNLSPRPRRADMLAVLDLAILYGLIPGILAALDLDRLTLIFWPRTDQAPWLAVAAASVEALAIWALVVRRWKKTAPAETP